MANITTKPIAALWCDAGNRNRQQHSATGFGPKALNGAWIVATNECRKIIKYQSNIKCIQMLSRVVTKHCVNRTAKA